MSHDIRAAPRTQVTVTALLIVAGVLILLIPAGDEGPVLVPVSEGHGLSAVDAAGAALLAVGGTWLEVLVVRRLPHLALPPRALFGLGLLAGLGVGLLVASVFSGFFWWWAIGAAALGVAVLVLAPLTARRSES
ncbi:hypothetical protein RMN56_18985 [Micromonospora halotolerans]|uniref:Major facilitator superfamily (MFS) profile domain-containing protein n=1 Tax=Micromonospora halotolerans TaxID=709879 RepID=A0ABY9ZPX6_9ACTN|nr:hypothetical protein [Micromonospora halotolerans]WNM37259.1 hypothetical protein RMN56_18985 [Micromonospora halotolerans]